MGIERVISTGFTVSNMARALDFYTGVLPFEVTNEVEVYGEAYEGLYNLFGLRLRIVTLQLGEEVLELTECLTPTGRAIPPDSGSNDRWFQHIAIVVRDMDAAYAHLRQCGVQYVSTAPQTLPEWNTAAAGIRAFYFRDPDGHNLEIIYFPAGKGDPRWQGRTDLFLGIDHTAIAVANTAESLNFYRDLLGLRVAGGSENYGTEQAHLNQVKDAHLQITTMKATGGPGIEFLQYLHPTNGRPMPTDTRINDLWYWQTTLAAADLQSELIALQRAGYMLPDSALIEIPDVQLGFTRAFVLPDPDDHLMRIVE